MNAIRQYYSGIILIYGTRELVFVSDVVDNKYSIISKSNLLKVLLTWDILYIYSVYITI